jgi:hypothetical protein
MPGGIKDMATIITSVEQAFEEYDPNLLNRAWITLFTNYNQCLRHNGCNKYKIEHMGKERMEREGLLPTTISVWEDDSEDEEEEDGEVPNDIFDNTDDEEDMELVDFTRDDEEEDEGKAGEEV